MGRFRADRAQAEKEQEQIRADRAEEQAKKLAARLKELGIDPDK